MKKGISLLVSGSMALTFVFGFSAQSNVLAQEFNKVKDSSFEELLEEDLDVKEFVEVASEGELSEEQMEEIEKTVMQEVAQIEKEIGRV